MLLSFLHFPILTREFCIFILHLYNTSFAHIRRFFVASLSSSGISCCSAWFPMGLIDFNIWNRLLFMLYLCWFRIERMFRSILSFPFFILMFWMWLFFILRFFGLKQSFQIKMSLLSHARWKKKQLKRFIYTQTHTHNFVVNCECMCWCIKQVFCRRKKKRR